MCIRDRADTVWVLVSAALVIFMTLPGLALFYGGLVRSKNVLSILVQNLVVFSLVAVLWALYGYSFAFTEGSAFIGGTDRLFAAGLNASSIGATFTKGVYIPELAFFVFQGAFPSITCAPVSYTHLDVYKRQASTRRWKHSTRIATSSRPAACSPTTSSTATSR